MRRFLYVVVVYGVLSCTIGLVIARQHFRLVVHFGVHRLRSLFSSSLLVRVGIVCFCISSTCCTTVSLKVWFALAIPVLLSFSSYPIEQASLVCFISVCAS